MSYVLSCRSHVRNELGPNELGPFIFLTTASPRKVEVGRNCFSMIDNNNDRFFYTIELKKIKKKLDVSLYKILCLNLDAYMNSISYANSCSHVNYNIFFITIVV